MARSHSAQKTAPESQKSDRHKSQRRSRPEATKQAKKQPADKKGKGKESTIPDAELDELRRQILALGGDEEDYQVLKDIDNGGAIPTPDTSKPDVALSKELVKFMNGLNFSSVKQPELNSDGEKEGQEEDEDDDDDDMISEDNENGQKRGVSQDKAKKEVKRGDAMSKDLVVQKVGPNAKLMLEPGPLWHTLLPPLSSVSKPHGPPSPQILSERHSRGAELHRSELSAYEHATSANKLISSASDAAFLQRVLSSGTLSDRLSALTLLVQSSPLHNTRALETLRSMAQKKGREESLKALRAIVDWWIGGGAPDRKLKYLTDQPLSHPDLSEKHLLLWYFEDWLKKYFFTILQILEALYLDPLSYVRMQSVSLIFTLLRDKPEQEQNLLRLLVNKLGDSERPVASRASYHLLQLLQVHPQMKSVVTREIAALILRPTRGGTNATTSSNPTHLKFADGIKSKTKPKPQEKVQKPDLQHEHARYYGVITLNQIMLTRTEADRAIALQLVGLYFELFREFLHTENSDDTTSIVTESVDHTRAGKEKRKKQREKRAHGKGNEKHEEGFTEIEDSNAKLISAILTGVNRALPYAKLGHDSIEFNKHIDTLFLISHKSTFNISLQALRLILQICQSLSALPQSSSASGSSFSASINDRYYRTLYASLHDPRLSTSSKQAMYLNLLLKSLKLDKNSERVAAFVRRFIQLLVGAGNGGVEFVTGGLFLLGELFKVEPSLRNLLGRQVKRAKSHGSEDVEYDPRKRDPQYAHAGASPMWEIYPLRCHFHPTVRLHASQLLSGTEVNADADLSLNTLSHFLDRFVYRNPRRSKPKGASAMQPAAAPTDGTAVRVVKGARVDLGVAVNDETFWRRDAKDVPIDQLFFHKYFSKKNAKEVAKAEKIAKRKGVSVEMKNEGEEGQDEDVSDANEAAASAAGEVSDDEEEIWKAIKMTNPDLRGEDEGGVSDEDWSTDVASDGKAEEEGEAPDEDENEDDGASEVETGYENNGSDQLSLAEGSDADDLVDLDTVLPDMQMLMHPEGSARSESDGDEDKEWSGFGNSGSKKRKRNGGAKEKNHKKLRTLPTFATYEDYAKLIEDAPEDDI